MSQQTTLEQITEELTKEFGPAALSELTERFGDAAAKREAAVAYHLCALRARGAAFQPARNHL